LDACPCFVSFFFSLTFSMVYKGNGSGINKYEVLYLSVFTAMILLPIVCAYGTLSMYRREVRKKIR
jgi:hypothetical protein